MRVPTFERLDHQRPAISVWLDNDEYGEVLKDFHCLVCGKIAFQYYNDVRMILPEDNHVHMKNPLVIQCNQRTTNREGYSVKCKTLYIVA